VPRGTPPFQQATSTTSRLAEGLEYGIEEFLDVKYLCMGGIDR
jgi:hypothetical protein